MIPTTVAAMEAVQWHVAHTKPRCEKKLARFAADMNVSVTLPLHKVSHQYLRKKVTFEKPLFPGYVFLRMPATERQKLYQSGLVANLLEVIDQVLFQEQLEVILKALESGLDMQLAPEITPGKRVRILSGPLQGVEGTVEERHGVTRILLRVDFISQAAAVRFEADQLELL
ncbi:MAG: UpxY family transcription antiterminator [Verrucomicrobiales bacterium]|nr:UpxY family transcription antiterminator [Verrucomicrobiales bacterium]